MHTFGLQQKTRNAGHLPRVPFIGIREPTKRKSACTRGALPEDQVKRAVAWSQLKPRNLPRLTVRRRQRGAGRVLRGGFALNAVWAPRGLPVPALRPALHRTARQR